MNERKCALGNVRGRLTRTAELRWMLFIICLLEGRVFVKRDEATANEARKKTKKLLVCLLHARK